MAFACFCRRDNGYLRAMSRAVTLRGALWIPTIYFAASLPNVVVGEVSKFFYKDLSLPVEQVTLLTGAMYLPWVIKPLWSPLVDLVRTKRWWIVVCQLALSLSFVALALAIHVGDWVWWTAAAFWLMAFASATHDVACDGFYMLGLSERGQAGYNGVRAVFYRLAAIAGKGGLVILAGLLGSYWGPGWAWSAAMLVPAAYLVFSAAYHSRQLPFPEGDRAAPMAGFCSGYLNSFVSFFRKPGILSALLFILLFRLGEGQMLAVVADFLIGERSQGCLGLSTAEVGWAYGTCGSLGVIAGGVLGSWVVVRFGLRRLFWPMIIIAHLPDLVFTWLAFVQPSSLEWVSAGLFVEQLGFGFGFSVYMLFLMYFARGPHRTSHFAIATGLMALGGMLPQMLGGPVATFLGYRLFYQYVLLCTLPGFWVAGLAWRTREFIDLYSPSEGS
jgi:PAT family beta-lactamase induction signal transducer AmpG